MSMFSLHLGRHLNYFSQRTEHGNCRHNFTLHAALSRHKGSSDMSKYPCMLKAV